jgi:serine/threonine protein kinase
MCSLASPAAPSPRTVAGRYDVLAHIDTGGMGIVHRVRDRRTDGILAIKQPWSRGLAGTTPCLDARASIARENLALSRLDHPHVVRLADAGTDESGEPFLVLELLERTRMIVDLPPAAAPDQRLRALIQMFHALAHVHAAELVHGDVTPSNVLLCGHPAWPGADAPPSLEPRVCVIDFGLAAGIGDNATLPGLDANGPPSLVGSALYLAPELIEGAPMSVASDLYAGGMIAAEVLTGTNPRHRSGPRTTLTALRTFPGEWLDDSTGAIGRRSRTAALLRRLLAPDPARRCACANEAVSELLAISRGAS